MRINKKSNKLATEIVNNYPVKIYWVVSGPDEDILGAEAYYKEEQITELRIGYNEGHFTIDGKKDTIFFMNLLEKRNLIFEYLKGIKKYCTKRKNHK